VSTLKERKESRIYEKATAGDAQQNVSGKEGGGRAPGEGGVVDQEGIG